MNNFKVNNISIHSFFSGKVFVTKNAGFQSALSKDILTENTYVSGVTKTANSALSPIKKAYEFYFPDATVKDLRKIKNFFKTATSITPEDEDDIFYEVAKVVIDDAGLEESGGYILTVTFTCQPFAYQLNQPTVTLTANGTLSNDTYNDMYPRIAVYGTSTSQTSLKIGSETMYFKALDTKLTIECKPGEQNVLDKYNAEANNVKRGDFFHVKPGSNAVTLGAGITKVEILCRWWW